MRLIICIVSILGICSLGLAQGAVDTGRGNSSKQSVQSSSKGKKAKSKANKSKAKKSSKANKSKAKKSSKSKNSTAKKGPKRLKSKAGKSGGRSKKSKKSIKAAKPSEAIDSFAPAYLSDRGPSAVRNLVATPTSMGELTVSWDAPVLGTATNYTVTMTTTTGNGTTTSQTEVTSQKSVTYTGLSPANAYAFSVAATNADGTSPSETAVFGQTPLKTYAKSFALTTGQDGSIWVGSAKSNNLVQIADIDGAWTPQPAISVEGEPIALTTGLDGSIWVSLQNVSAVQQLTNVNGAWTAQDPISVKVSEVGYQAENIAITTNSDGSIWVANRNYNSVQQIAETYGVWTTATPLSLSIMAGDNNVGPLPSALTPGLDGSIWFANQGTESQGGNSVQQAVNLHGVWTAQTAITVGSTPQALTTGLDGSIWVANTGNNTVQQIAQENGGWVAQPAIAVGEGPQGLATGLDGSIWVANTASNTVQQIASVDGVWTAMDPIAAGDNPFGLTVGLDGSLWVTNTDSNTLQQIVLPTGIPLDLSADASSSPGKITLNWNPPDTDGGAPITTYTATVKQGNQTQSIQTSDTSATFEGLTAGGPINFTVTASNFAGNSNGAEVGVAAPTPPLSLTAESGRSVGEMTLSWQPPLSNNGAPVSSYNIRLRSGDFSRTLTTNETSLTVKGLTALKPYAIDIWASNAIGDGPVETAFHTLLDIRTVGDQVTAWDIRRSLLPPEPTDPQGNLLTPLTTPWGNRLGFPGVSYQAIWAATPSNPAEVPALTLPASSLGNASDSLSDGRSISMWVQAKGPGVLLSATVETSDGDTVEVPYLWIDTDGNVNGGFYGSDAFAYKTGQTILSYQTLRGDTVIGSPLAITGQVSVIDNNWHHVALVADSDTQSLFIDGLLQGTTKPLVIQREPLLVSSLYGNTITIPLDAAPQAGETFSARIFQDETLSFILTSTGPLRAVTPLSVSATDVVTPGSSYTPVASATLLVPASGTPQLQIVMQDAVHAQNPLSAMLIYTNAAGSSFQIMPTTGEPTTEIKDYQVGTSVFPASTGATLPQANYPQPFIGAIDDLSIWHTALPQASIQAAMTAPVNTAVNGVVLPGGTTLAGIAPPSFTLDFSAPVQVPNSENGYTFANAAPQGDSTLVATSTLLTVGIPATIPASQFSNDPAASNYLPRLGNFQNYGIGLMTPLYSGSVRVHRGSPLSAQIALAQGDVLTFTLDGSQPTTVAFKVADEFGTISTETISTGNPVSLVAAYTGTFKVTLEVPTDSLIASIPVAYSQMPGAVNQLQPLLSVYEQRLAAYTSFESAYADPTIPTSNPMSNLNGVAASLATGAADYFPLWSDTTYFPTSATTDAGKLDYAQRLSAAYESLVEANGGLSFANLYFQNVDGSRSIPEQIALDLATAYREAFDQEPPQLLAGATSFTPSSSDSPEEAIYKFFSNVNRWRLQADTALRSLAASIASIAPQSAPYEIADLIATNQAEFVTGQTDGIVSEAGEEDLGDIAKDSSIELGIKGSGKIAEMGIKKLGKGELASTGVGLGVEMGLKMLNGWLKVKREPESPTSSVYVSFVPIIEAMTEYDSLEALAQSISENNDAFTRRIETQLTNPAFLQSIYSNFGLLKALAGVSGDGVEQLADSGALDNAAAEFSAHQAWSAMVPAAFSWEQVTPDHFPAANIQNSGEDYGWTEEPLQINSGNSSDPVSMATGDFNGDGYPDLVLSNTGGTNSNDRQNLLVLFAIPNLNGNQKSVGYTTGWSYTEVTDSSGDFTKVIEFDEEGEDNELPSGVAVGDFNNDGNDDIVVNFEKTSNAAIWLGSNEVSSTGSIASPEYAGSLNLNGGEKPGQVVVADFNNDGWMDFASACTDSNSLVVAINTTGLPEDETFPGIGVKTSGNENTLGELRFTTYNISMPSHVDLSGALATGDLNNDGYPDLAATTNNSNGSGATICFLVSTTDTEWDGFRSVAESSFPTYLAGDEITIGDFDGDGFTDDIAFLGYQPGSPFTPVAASMLGNGNQQVKSVTANNLVGSRLWAQGLWLSIGEPNQYTSSTVVMTPQWMGYGGIVGLETIPKALKYGAIASGLDLADLPDGLAYSYANTTGGWANNSYSMSIAVVPTPLEAQKAFWNSPAIFTAGTKGSNIWNGDGASYQVSFGELTQNGTNGGYTDVVVSQSGMIAAASGQGGNVNDNYWYSQVSWSNNVLSNSLLSTFLPNSGEELGYVTSTGELPSGYNADDYVVAAIAAMQAGVPTTMPFTEYGLSFKVASPNFFLGAVNVMVNENGETVDANGRSIFGWNLVDNSGNPIALETASQLFGLTTPATRENERGATDPLPPVLPQLWEPVDRALEFADPSKPLRAYNGMWYADMKPANSAVTSIANAFFLWGRNDAWYHPGGLLSEDALDLFLPFTDGNYTITLAPIPNDPPTLQLPAPTNLKLAVADTGTATLSWNAPAFASASPVLYTIQVFNGVTGASITSLDTTDTQAVFANLLSPYTSYYTVTATIPGASSVAGYAPWLESNPSLPAAVRDNVFVGVATEGIPFVGGGLSGTGLTYNYQDLEGSLGYRGIDFTLVGSNTPNMIASTGETFEVDGTAVDGSPYNVIHLAAAAVGRSQENVEIIVTTTDGTTITDYTWTQSFSDWKASEGFSGESIIASMDTAIANSGVAIPFETADGAGAYNLYGYSWRVPAGQTVTSITLPDNQLLNVLDIKLAQVEQVQISSMDWSEWNASGIGTFNQQPNSGGFDSDGQYYAGSDLPPSLELDLGNVQIALGNPNSDTRNTVNNVLLVNDPLTIDLSSSSNAIVGVSLAAAYTEHGGSQTATISPSFDDASTDSWDFQLYPWLYRSGSPPTDAPPILSTISQYVLQDGGKGSGTTYIYGYQYDSPSAAKITSLSLPANSGLGILGLTVETLAAESAGILIAAPLAPQALTVTNTSIPQFAGDDGSVTLSWDPPAYDGGEPVTSYTATMQVGDLVKTFNTTSTSQLFDVYDTGVGNLPTTFTVTANSAAGSSEAAELAPAPPSAPQGLAYTVSDTGQVTLSWAPPVSDGGAPIAYYMLESSTTFERPITDSTSYTFDVTPPGELTAPMDVTVSVVAVNVAGLSDADTRHFVITPPPPASAPQNLTAVLGPGAGQITLSWQPPATSDLPVTSYTITTAQSRSSGQQTFTVTAVPGSSAALSYVLDNVEFFDGPPDPYNTLGSLIVSVTANNALGSGLQAGLLIDSNYTTYPLDTVAYAANEQPFLGGGLDGNGNAFSWEAMATASTSYPGAGNRVGNNGLVWPMLQMDGGGGSLEFSGVFKDQPSVIVPAGQTISFPQYGWQYDLTTSNTLALAAVAVNGDQANQQFILNFTDGSTATYDLDIIDWLTDPADVAGLNSDVWVVANQTYYNTAAGGRVDESNSIFGYVVSLGGKTLQSVTLPSNSNVRLIGMKPFESTGVTSAPRYLTATPVSQSGLNIEWGRPAVYSGGPNTAITYEVTVTQGGSSQTFTTTETTYLVAAGLVLGEHYKVSVTPKTSYGVGGTAEVEDDYPSTPPQ